MKNAILILLCFLIVSAKAQTIKGTLTQLAKQEIKLEGFNGLNTYLIAKTTPYDNGNNHLFNLEQRYRLNHSFFILLLLGLKFIPIFTSCNKITPNI